MVTRQTSLHHRILRDIEDRILSGDWRPGHRIPSEHALAAEYGCSRMTINKAVTQLAKAGYVERRRRAGSFVRQPHVQSAVLEIHSIEAEVASLGLPYRYELVDRRCYAGDAVDRERLDLVDEDSLLEVTCRHLAGDEPFCLEQRLINLTAVPDAEKADFAIESPGAWLLKHVPWSVAEHTIAALGADATTARRLAVPEQAPCLAVERRTWNAEHVVTFVRLTYPGDRHSLVARFSPSHR